MYYLFKMHYIIKPTRYERNKWVAAKDNLNAEDIRNIILGSDLIISDLDKTIAKWPTRRVIERNFIRNPWTIVWGFFSLLRIMKIGKRNRYKIWIEYFTRFPDLPRDVSNIEKASKKIYPGCEEFFDYVNRRCPHQKQILVTMTDERIGMPYQGLLGFDEAHYQKLEKYKVVEELIAKYNPRIISIAGDSIEDKKMVDAGKSAGLEYCLGINVVKSTRKINEDFDINIGRNWKGLQDIINSVY